MKNFGYFLLASMLIGFLGCEADIISNDNMSNGDYDNANNLANMEVPHEINFIPSNDTTMDVKFHIGSFSDSAKFVVVPVDFTRIDGSLKAKDNDQIDISYIEYKQGAIKCIDNSVR